jgi:hypothetical protein
MSASQTLQSAGTGFRLLDYLTLTGFSIYALAAPHSIAGSWAGISIVILAWLVRTIVTRRTGLRRTAFDLPLWLFFGWTFLSAIFSIEPRLSIPKLINVATLLVFYLAQAMLTRRLIITMSIIWIVSAAAGVLWGTAELILGRGVTVAGLNRESFLRTETPLQEGDVIWRVNGRRVSSVEEIDARIKATPPGQRLHLSVISHGEHVEWPGPIVADSTRREPSPSGITGGGRSHRFRASGWTRHYETFAEMLQIIGQLALGFALTQWLRKSDKTKATIGILTTAAFLILAFGIVLTAMRTTLLAFTLGMLVTVWRATVSKRQRTVLVAMAIVIVALGGLVVWRTRAGGALALQDPSAYLRVQVAAIAARRVTLHPILGHGMDAMHAHWNEWGFPGKDMLDAHSTPIQIAFDRGLPALGLWIWLMFIFWRATSQGEIKTRHDTTAIHGFSLGVLGALAGFLVSSLVNYNFGDSEVALLLWWMMGAVVVIGGKVTEKARVESANA